jgi:DNA helicase-2/ATP-dependent DNA helicase PcrA
LDLSGLNEQQHRAVTHPGGPVLVTAGPGSGKSRVLTHRAAYLIEQGIPASRLLLLTFTNKAADEMAERVKLLTGGSVEGMWMGTFHSTCVKLLRNQGVKFVIADEHDRRDMLGSAMERIGIDPKSISPGLVGDAISRMKNDLVGVNALCTDPERYSEAYGLHFAPVADIWRAYENIKSDQNALDFDDLLFEAVAMLANYPDVANYYRELFLHILVDEAQDTNKAQFELVKLLVGQHRNVFLCGDLDQSIYGWRGADFRNMMEFAEFFHDSDYIQLGQNYRSTGVIVNASSELIGQNTGRFYVSLFTRNEEGNPIRLLKRFNADEESEAIKSEIVRLHEQGIDYKEIAVLYRINALSADVETALRLAGIPYQVVGAYKFFDRKEVRDFLAYAKLIVNPVDGLNLSRIINVPKRGLGQKSIDSIREFAGSRSMDMLEAIRDPEIRSVLSKQAYRGLLQFTQLLDEMTRYVNYPNVFFQELLNRSAYSNYLRDQYNESAAMDRIDNLQALVNIAARWSEGVGGSLEEFLMFVSLMSDADDKQDNDTVKLMTIHAAKGLEFDAVFVRAVEDDILPHSRCSSPDEREEERRLLYVAMTRAKKLLYMTIARFRRVWGKETQMEPSPFLREIPVGLTEER